MCLAIPGRIIDVVDVERRLARVEVAGVTRTVSVGLLEAEHDGAGAQAGDWVLIHVGFALSRIDEEEADATLRLLQDMGADYEQELEELKASVIE
jgi:hydrogenase expression/formation protein HypC